MSGDETKTHDPKHRDLAGWIAGRRGEVERWVEEACQRAVARTRGVVAEEIRALSRRVERMHELLDHLERIVETQKEEGLDPASRDGEGEGDRD